MIGGGTDGEISPSHGLQTLTASQVQSRAHLQAKSERNEKRVASGIWKWMVGIVEDGAKYS